MMKSDVSSRSAIAGWLFLTWLGWFLAWPVSATAMTTKILLIGDSLSSGYGLAGPGWVELTNRQFAREGHDIHIANDSITGDTTAGGLARLADGILRINPDWVLIELGGNDGLRGIRPRVIEDNLRQMVEIAASRGVRAMLLGMRIPPNYGTAYTARFERVYENVSADTGAPLLPFFTGELVLDPAYMQPDMIHPNDAAQPLIRDRVAPFLLSATKLFTKKAADADGSKPDHSICSLALHTDVDHTHDLAIMLARLTQPGRTRLCSSSMFIKPRPNFPDCWHRSRRVRMS